MLWAIRMCLWLKLDNGNNTLALLEALGCASGHSLCSCIIIGIIPEVKLVPEAQPRDTYGRGVLFLLSTLGRKQILMAQRIAEGQNTTNFFISNPQNLPISG